MTSKLDKCQSVITIPQTDNVGSCWFNSILMSILYSQYSRNLLLTNNSLDKKKDKISKILNQLLKQNYIKNKFHEDYFKYMRPEIILKYLDIFPTVDEYKKVLTKGHRSILVIHKFIKKLNKTSLNLDLYEGELYGNLNLITENITDYSDNNKIFKEAISLVLDTTITKAYFTTNPDYIIVSPNGNLEINNINRYSYQEYIFYLFKALKKEYLLKKFNLDTYNIKTDGIKNLSNEIVYNGDKYILDSCLLSNFNTTKLGGHAITGITCNNNRYVYNGWLRDNYSKNKKRILPLKKMPCELMKLDWEINKSKDFCLNLKKCKLDTVRNKNDLCFSFNKGPRNLIYVKVAILDTNLDIYKNYSSSETLTLPSTSKLTNTYDDIYIKRQLKELLKKKPKKEEKKEEEKKEEEKKDKKKEKKPKKEEKKVKNINNFIKKLNEKNEINLRLMEREGKYYITSCCDDVADKLTIRNPDYIIIDNYSELTPIKYISYIEYLLNLKNYNIHLKKNSDGSIIYDDYKYEIYAKNDYNIIYKIIYKTDNIIKNTNLRMSKKKFSNTKDELNEYIDVIKKSKKNKEISQQLMKIKKFLNVKKLSKADYVKMVKMIYPYYINLNKYNIDKLKSIYETECNQIKLNYENNSCYLDSLFVALFNSKNKIVEEFLLKSPLNTLENKNDEKLISYANQIRAEMKILNSRISSTIDANTCTSLRLSFKKFYDRYKSKINSNYHKVEWLSSQNDFSEVIQLLDLIFAYEPILKYSMNKRVEKRSFFDINNFIDVFNNDIVYIKDYYPKYTNMIELDNGKIRKETNEYLAAPLLLIQINRIYDFIKKEAKIIPELKLKLKENDLYLNSIIIHYGNETTGHYICLYECKGIWNEFDDIHGKSKIIQGGFDAIIKNDRYTRNIVGLFYISI
jgi:hypothetical protein